MNAHLLWITPRWPLPPIDGARQATVALIRGLTSAGARVDLVPYVNADDEVDAARAMAELGVASVTPVPRGDASWAARIHRLVTNPLVPITVGPFVSSRVAHIVEAAIADHPGIRVVLDGLHAGAWCLSGLYQPEAANLVFRPHNVERALWMQAAKTRGNPLIKLGLHAQGLLVGRLERMIAQGSGFIFPVSDIDGAVFRAIAPHRHVRTVPIGLEVAAQPRRFPEGRPMNLLFLGRLDWEPNRAGLSWFLREVWPEAAARRPDMHLNIAGSGNGAWLDAFLALPNLSIIGRVPDVVPWYEGSTAVIVPIFMGSGTRVKVIEASLMARTVIGTELGVEGVGLQAGKSYIRAQSTSEWIEALVSLSPDLARTIGLSAREAVSRQFDARRVAEDMLATLVGSAGQGGDQPVTTK